MALGGWTVGQIGVGGCRNYPAPTLTQKAYLRDTTNLGNLLDITTSGNYMYIAAYGTGRMSIVDISTITAPTVVGSLSGLGQSNGICVDGNTVYVNTNSGWNLHAIDVTTKTAPTLISTLPFSGSSGGYVAILDSTYLIAGSNANFKIIDKSTPSSMSVVATVSGSGYDDIHVDGTQAYIGGGSSIRSVDLSTPTSPVIDDTLTASGLFHRISDYLVGSRAGLLRLWDYSDVTDLVLTATKLETASSYWIRGYSPYFFVVEEYGFRKNITTYSYDQHPCISRGTTYSVPNTTSTGVFDGGRLHIHYPYITVANRRDSSITIYEISAP